MEVLIIGNGGREYALGLSLQNECRVDGIYFYPGNGATSKLGKNLEHLSESDLLNFLRNSRVKLVIVGPEAPLVSGLGDKIRQLGISVFGPSQSAARLEASKSFMKTFATKYSIPTAKYIQTNDINEAYNFIDALERDFPTKPFVVKADGLCGGKGVIIAKDSSEAKKNASLMLSGESFGDAGRTIVIEEFLEGFEISVFAICDGKNFITLPVAQDHKRLLDGDRGPNTGGMGAYAPTPLADKEIIKKVEEEIIKPTLLGMEKEGVPFCGVLFCGIMVVGNNPKLLEFNVRFGDPECEVILPLLKTPLLDILLAATECRLSDILVEFKDGYCVGVVVASVDYPYATSPKVPILLEFKDNNTSHIDFAGVSLENGKLLASGGRVLVCVGIGKTLQEAQTIAYNTVNKVHFEGMQFRKDIAWQVLGK